MISTETISTEAITAGYAFFVQESPSSPKEEWPRNGMIFATETEAKQYGCDLLSRWFGICGGEVRPVDLQPTYKWVDGRAERLLLPAEQPEGTDVCQDSVGPCRGTDMQTEANAYLVAAAPDLYAALEALLENNLGTQVDDGGAWDSCCDMAKSALAKARGEA